MRDARMLLKDDLGSRNRGNRRFNLFYRSPGSIRENLVYEIPFCLKDCLAGRERPVTSRQESASGKERELLFQFANLLFVVSYHR